MKFIRSGVMLLLLAGGILSFAAAQQAQDSLRPKPGNPVLRSELLAMRDRDQDIRNEWIRRMSAKSVDSAFVVQMNALDRTNTQRIKAIIREFGWPGTSLVGQDGAEAAFLIVQHSPDTSFQKSCLPLLTAAFKGGEVSGQDLALLTDRVLVREGKPQLYGSQAKLVGGRLILDPIEDQANVDKRRASLGLPPLSEYLEFLKQLYHLKD